MGESPFKSQQIEPTPLGQPTAVPRFSNLAKRMEAKFQDATISEAGIGQRPKLEDQQYSPTTYGRQSMGDQLQTKLQAWEPQTKFGAGLKSLIA